MCDLSDRLASRSLAHADQDDALAHRHHVATFERRGSKVLVGVAEPNAEVSVLELRMELIDGTLQQRFRLSRGPEHRIAGYTAVDPTRRITLEQGVRNRRDHKRDFAHRIAQHFRPLGLRNVTDRNAADQVRGKGGLRHLVQPRSQRRCHQLPDSVLGDAAVKYPRARLGCLQCLGQQVVELQHLDATLPHLQHEVVVIFLCLLHPDNVVKQQLVAVPRCKAAMSQTGTADHNCPQRADFRMDPELTHLVLLPQ